MLKSKRKIILLLVIVAIFVVLAAPAFTQAAGLVPCGGPTESPCTVRDVFYGLARITNWLIMSAGIYAFYEIVSGGFWLVASAGQEEAITKNKNRLYQAFIGLFIVFAAYMFMNTAVNFILMSKCKVNLASPLSYVLSVQDPSKCDKNPVNDQLK
jgi:hypothetical protein